MEKEQLSFETKKEIVNAAYQYFLSENIQKDLYVCIYRSLSNFIKRKIETNSNFKVKNSFLFIDKQKFLKVGELINTNFYEEIETRVIYTYKIFLHNFFENFILDLENNTIRKSIENLYFLKEQDVIEDMFFNQFKQILSSQNIEKNILNNINEKYLIFLILYKNKSDTRSKFTKKHINNDKKSYSKIHNRFLLITSIKNEINENNFPNIIKDMNKLKYNYNDISDEDLKSYMKTTSFLMKCNNEIRRKIMNNNFVLNEI